MKMMSPIDTNKRGRDPHYFICRISYLIIGIFIIHCPHPVFSATPVDSVAQVALSRVQIESLINRAGTTVKYGDVLIARGESVAGPLVVVDGTLFVSGTVTGDLIVLNGSASLQRDAVVTGNLIVGGGYIYASRHARISGRRTNTSDRYLITRTSSGQLELKLDQPGPLAFRIKPAGWRFTRVRGHDFALTIGLEPRTPAWYPKITGTVFIPTVKSNHGYLDFIATLEEALFEKYTLRLGISGYKMMDTADRWHMPPYLNSLAAFVTRNDFYNYYLKQGATFYAQQRLSEKSSVRLSYLHDRFFNLSNQAPSTLFGGNRGFRLNPDVDEGDIHSLTLHFELDKIQNGTGWDVDALIERAISAPQSEYTRYDFTGRLKNAWGRHQLDIRAKIAGSDSPLPLQRTYVLGAINGLRGFGDFELAGDRLFIANVDYRLPLKTFRSKSLITWHLDLLTFFDTGTAYFNPTSGRNNPAHPVLLERVNPRVDLALPFKYTDLRSDAGLGLSLSSPILKVTLTVAQNLHTTAAKPRVLIFFHRDLF
jgi:hypothetical protein